MSILGVEGQRLATGKTVCVWQNGARSVCVGGGTVKSPHTVENGVNIMYCERSYFLAVHKVFSRNSRFLNIRENMYFSKITLIVA